MMPMHNSSTQLHRTAIMKGKINHLSNLQFKETLLSIYPINKGRFSSFYVTKLPSLNIFPTILICLGGCEKEDAAEREFYHPEIRWKTIKENLR